jgi:hypothetical protein
MGYQEHGKKESLSGVGKSQVLIEMPPGAFDMIAPTITYTVTDAGLAAGETMFGAITRMRIYEEGANQAIFDVTGEQFKTMCYHWRPDSIDESNVIFDTLPTTATEHKAQCQLHMPMLIDNDKVHYLEVNIDPSSEFGSATAFTGEFSLQYEPGTPAVSFGLEMPTIRSEDKHRIDISYFEQTITRILVEGLATANDVSEVKLESSDGGRDIDLRNPVGPALQYNIQYDQATTMTNLMQGLDFTDLGAAWHRNRELQFDLGTAAQPDVYVYYIDSVLAGIGGTAGDVSRGTADVATVKLDNKEAAKQVVTDRAEVN